MTTAPPGFLKRMFGSAFGVRVLMFFVIMNVGCCHSLFAAWAQSVSAGAGVPSPERFLALVISKSGHSIDVVQCFSGKRVSVQLASGSEFVANGKHVSDLRNVRPGDFAVISDYAQGHALIARYVITDEHRSATFRERLGRTLAIGTVIRIDKEMHRVALREIDGVVLQLALSKSSDTSAESSDMIKNLRKGDRLMARGRVQQNVFKVDGIQRLTEEQVSLVGAL